MVGIHVTTNVELLEISRSDPVSLLQLLNGAKTTYSWIAKQKYYRQYQTKDGTCMDQKSNIVELPKNKLMLESRNIKPTGFLNMSNPIYN